ncbi:unnamed protein product [Caenorhabditis nigoni]
MPKISAKKFVLIGIEDDSDSKQNLRRLRRYLNSHKMKYVCSSNPLEMAEYLDKLQNNKLALQDYSDNEEDVEHLADVQHPPITPNLNSSNQELLEQWARGTFSEGSEEMKLLFGASSQDQETSAQEQDASAALAKTSIEIPQLFTLHSIEPDDGVDNGKDEGQDTVNCLICECPVGIGRNRNTRIKRQAEHIIHSHPEDEFRGVEISKRYQCLQCNRILPVSKSPCDHIGEHHGNDACETEFRDLWTKSQLLRFNVLLEKCFNRHLPVPRSRRFRKENPEAPSSKASYRIVQGDEVLQINTVIEKAYPAAENGAIGTITIDDESSTPNTGESSDSNYTDNMRAELYEIDDSESKQADMEGADYNYGDDMI